MFASYCLWQGYSALPPLPSSIAHPGWDQDEPELTQGRQTLQKAGVVGAGGEEGMDDDT